MSGVDLEDLRELTRTLDRLRRYLEYERIVAISKLYAWWSVAGLLGGAASLAVSALPASPATVGALQAAIWLTIAALITRAFAENMSRVEELSRTLSEEGAWGGEWSRVAATWLVAFAVGIGLPFVVGRFTELTWADKLTISLCSALGLGNASNWAVERLRGRDPGREPAIVGAVNLASIPLLLPIGNDVTQYGAMILMVSLSYAWAGLSYAAKAKRVLAGGRRG